MSPKQITKLRESLDLDQGRFAELVGVSRTTVNHWETGKHPPRGLSLRVLRELAEKQGKKRNKR